jgi:23S rRNA pseudouridine1911/1915/1917 synthase
MIEDNVQEILVDEALNKERLDLILVRTFETTITGGASRAQVQRWIDDGRVQVDSVVVKRPGVRCLTDSKIIVNIPAPVALTVLGEEMPLDIIYEDQHLLCLNKPPGLTIHPGAGQHQGTLLNALVHYIGSNKSVSAIDRPWIVHRLDKDTSGILVIAKNDVIHRALSAQFQERTVEKEYRALVLATPKLKNPAIAMDSGVIERSIDRCLKTRTKMVVKDEGGRAARTTWKVIERFDYGALLSVIIETGRTHQIRVHFESIGAPVIGDKTYGNFKALPSKLFREQQSFGRQALHSFKLQITHPVTEQRLAFEAPLPKDFLALLGVWRGYRH